MSVAVVRTGDGAGDGDADAEGPGDGAGDGADEGEDLGAAGAAAALKLESVWLRHKSPQPSQKTG